MVFYSRFKGKKTYDRIMVFLFLLYCIVNVFSHLIVQVFGGLGNIVVIYFFVLYFAFVYGEPVAGRSNKIYYASLVIFLIIYVPMMQFLYDKAQFYNTAGIPVETHVWNLVSFVPMILSAVFIVQKTTVEMVVWMKRVFVGLLLVTLIPSIVMLVGNPSLAKQSATGSGEYIPFLVNYSTIYALSTIVPCLIFSFSPKNKVFKYVLCAVVVICIYMSSFFIAVLATIFGVFICFLFRINNTIIRRFFILLSLIMLVAFFCTDMAYNLFLRLSSITSLDMLKVRASQLATFFKTGYAGDTTARIDLYKGAVELIMKHPILGNILLNSDAKLSGHSEILDVWGGCGLAAVGCLLSFFASVYKMNLNLCVNSRHLSAFKSSTLVLLFVSLFNPIFSSPTICVFWIIAPLFLAQ